MCQPIFCKMDHLNQNCTANIEIVKQAGLYPYNPHTVITRHPRQIGDDRNLVEYREPGIG